MLAADLGARRHVAPERQLREGSPAYGVAYVEPAAELRPGDAGRGVVLAVPGRIADRLHARFHAEAVAEPRAHVASRIEPVLGLDPEPHVHGATAHVVLPILVVVVAQRLDEAIAALGAHADDQVAAEVRRARQLAAEVDPERDLPGVTFGQGIARGARGAASGQGHTAEEMSLKSGLGGPRRVERRRCLGCPSHGRKNRKRRESERDTQRQSLHPGIFAPPRAASQAGVVAGGEIAARTWERVRRALTRGST